MKNLLLAAVLVLAVGCSSTTANAPLPPRFSVGDRVETPSGPGTVTEVKPLFQYNITLDNGIEGVLKENPADPFEGVKKLK